VLSEKKKLKLVSKKERKKEHMFFYLSGV